MDQLRLQRPWIMAGPAGSRHLVDLIVGRVEHNPFRLDRDFVTRSTDVL